MSQNTSTAVMQRRVEAHDSLDDFPTPPWATRALCEHILFRIGTPNWNRHCPPTVCYRFGLTDPVAPERALVPPAYPIPGLTVWEPACNRGFMARPLAEYFGTVRASDIHHYGWEGQQQTVDFLFPGEDEAVGWVITNPPFRLAEQFVEKARRIAKVGCAVIVRSAFLESVGRYENLFRDNPPAIIAQFTERVVMVKGRIDPTGSTATAYCWLVWLRDEKSTSFKWIPPCRKALEKPSDYSFEPQP